MFRDPNQVDVAPVLPFNSIYCVLHFPDHSDEQVPGELLASQEVVSDYKRVRSKSGIADPIVEHCPLAQVAVHLNPTSRH